MNSVAKPPPSNQQQQQQQQQSSTEFTTKKKFGKNLNKLTKPPPPPNSTNASSKANGSSRNGLLLLSTKRPSSGTNTASAGGILASKPVSLSISKPLPSLGLQNKSSPSTHDALLGAVVGASRAESQEPDAWGIAEKQKSPMNEGDLSSSPSLEPAQTEVKQYFNTNHQETEATAAGHSLDRLERIVAQSSELPSTNWDEYGGRNLSATGSSALYSPDDDPKEDDQKAAMARMAKERAEKRRAEEEARQNDQREKSAQRLRELDEKKGPAVETTKEQPTPRTLFDPNAPAKSLSPPTKSKAASLQNGNTPNGSYNPELQIEGQDALSRQPVIQLSRYDDRDRGERGGTTAPRMLYDPKSGSMVAVSTKDESALGGRVRKERGKKAKPTRDKEPNVETKPEADIAKGLRKGKREKKQLVESPSIVKQDAKKKLSKERKVPRTCGVLYSRDTRGNFVCLDGCDGDLGYGAHSVPGGRVKNTDGYASYLEDQKRAHQDDDGDGLHTSYDADTNRAEVTLHTGFSISEPELKFDWVKPSDKIELITGIDDSPTLQATAKEWAPSQAALAAAAARLGNGVEQEPTIRTSSFQADDEDLDDDDGPFGLGFDPTLHMDSMMQSPSAESPHGLDAVDLPSLSLEPAYQSAAKTNHIFAFGAGSTWGASDTGSGSDTWGTPSSTSNAATFLSLSSGKTWGGLSAFGGALGSSSLNGDRSRSAGD